MRSFFKIFFATLLALVVFTLMVFFFLIGMAGGWASKSAPHLYSKSVLVLDLGQHYAEQYKEDPFGILKEGNDDVPGLYDVVRLLGEAKTDKDISGVYIIAENNPNGFAADEELRNALKDFKASGKFVLAYGDVMSQKAYDVANIADKVYINPSGYMEWTGFSAEYFFLKGALDKLDIQPQIFYAGKFKSATEIFRTEKMTPENQLQTSVWLNDLYANFLLQTSEARKIDTATLHQLANDAAIQTTADAVTYKLIDAAKYDDEVKDEIKIKLGIDKYEKTHFISINDYREIKKPFDRKGDKIALIYAEGDIVDGKGGDAQIGGETYQAIIRKARLDKTVKAIVLRVNSGGGSSLASENIWRELSLAKKEKPVIVSFGDVAASGGYYISTGADSIFAERTTITGSIGVFGIIPDMELFFKNKLGVTFDGVKTAPHADMGAIYRPVDDRERQLIQKSVEVVYAQFKQRVADGRKKDTAYIDSIAQGRVWTGMRAKDLGLIDRFGGIGDAVRAAAAKAKLTSYHISEYPEPRGLLSRLFGGSDPMNYSDKLKAELGEENYKIFIEMKRIREMTNTIQARLPFQFMIH